MSKSEKQPSVCQIDAETICQRYPGSHHHGLDDIKIQDMLATSGSNEDEYDGPNLELDYLRLRCISYWTTFAKITALITLGCMRADWYAITYAVMLIFLASFYFYLQIATINYAKLDAAYTHAYNPAFKKQYHTTVIRNTRDYTKKCQLLVSGYLKKYTIITEEYEMKINDDIPYLIGKYCHGFIPQTISTSKLVPFDIVIINKGDAIRANMRVVECSDDFAVYDFTKFAIESLRIQPKTNEKLLYDWDIIGTPSKNMLYPGSFGWTGTAKAIVTSTGKHRYRSNWDNLRIQIAKLQDISKKENSKYKQNQRLAFSLIKHARSLSQYIQYIRFVCSNYFFSLL